MEVGFRIRERRRELGLTQKALAMRAGVSRAMLSDIERDVKNPTIRVLSQIAGGLECTISSLIEEKGRRDLQVIRKAERHVLIDSGSGAKRFILSPMAAEEGTDILCYELAPQSNLGTIPPRFSETLIHITVTSGSMICEIEKETIALKEGDSITFYGDCTRRFSNPGQEPCHFFMVIHLREGVR